MSRNPWIKTSVMIPKPQVSVIVTDGSRVAITCRAHDCGNDAGFWEAEGDLLEKLDFEPTHWQPIKYPENWEIRLFTAADFVKMEFSVRSEIASYLRVAADLIEYSKDREDSASWRIADAGAMLREIIERDKAWMNQGVPGVTKPTGRGAMLPTIKNG